MSDVLFAATVAQRSGTDVATADRVITSTYELIRDMALAGTAVQLVGVGTFEVKAKSLTFKPVQRLTRIVPAAMP